MQNKFEQSWSNLEPIFILESCQEQMITSKRIELQTSNTTHLKEHFQAFLIVIWFLHLHDLDVEKKVLLLRSMNSNLGLGEIWTGISESSLLPNQWSHWPIQTPSWKIFSRPFQWSYCFYVYFDTKHDKYCKTIFTVIFFFATVRSLAPGL